MQARLAPAALSVCGLILVCALITAIPATAEDDEGEGSGAIAFEQLGYLLPTPSETRTASGAPGPDYWQQRADYTIRVELDDENQRILGSETITYHNRSPHALKYVWIQLDQNRFRPDSDDVLSDRAPDFEKFPYRTLAQLLERRRFEGGVEILKVADGDDRPLEHHIVKTMMRVDLPTPLASGASFELRIDWRHNILDAVKIRARGGYEYFPEDDNYIYEIAQWYPRLAAYTDYKGWQNKQFLKRGEFTLELGDFRLEITVPADHIVAATGVLQNPEEVLTEAQHQRLRKAETAAKPMFVVTPAEAKQNQKSRSKAKKTWIFQADNVRDVAFASSRKFIWDAMAHESSEQTTLAMSFYPIEAEPLWSQYSTHAVVHTLEVYSRYTFEYPYPVAISVNGPVGGMEYPMISFNKPRPYPDQTYWDSRQESGDHTWERSKYGLISVIIHEVGHNYFPMIVNSDERQWTWMDEGLNTFLQFVAEQAWEDGYPSRRGEPDDIVPYMVSDHKVPIMTHSESILQFGSNSYAKPATALNILRESILGREIFDFAFKEFAQRWKFKRPTPADFFRTMEDASAVDLDWFWRGWFYSTDHVDIAIDKITLYELDTQNPDIEKPRLRQDETEAPQTLSKIRNRNQPKRLDRFPELTDFYNSYDEFDVTPYDYAEYRDFVESLNDRERVLLETDALFYVVDFVNIGGLPMPLPLRVTYADGSVEDITIPAEIWRYNNKKVAKLFITDREMTAIVLDPHHSLADADRGNNSFPREVVPSRFQLFKVDEDPNPMKRERMEDDEP